jgi:hypothetical protein
MSVIPHAPLSGNPNGRLSSESTGYRSTPRGLGKPGLYSSARTCGLLPPKQEFDRTFQVFRHTTSPRPGVFTVPRSSDSPRLMDAAGCCSPMLSDRNGPYLGRSPPRHYSRTRHPMNQTLLSFLALLVALTSPSFAAPLPSIRTDSFAYTTGARSYEPVALSCL